MKRLIFIIACAALLVGCSRQHDVRLDHVATIVSDDPEQALAALDSIAYDSLSTADRHYHDFLTIKARDKAYVTHTSDSLILDVIDYYEGTDLYPEALYYGGRVYSDLGDYPTALDYFQRGLDEVRETGTENIAVKGNLLSQTARLLNSLRLYTQAVPYMREVLALDSLERDTFNLAYDYQLLGAIYMCRDSLVQADLQFKKAQHWAMYLQDKEVAEMLMYRADVKLKLNDIDSALILIKDVPQRVDKISENLSFAKASKIYMAAGMLDSAYHYADLLIHSANGNNRKSGYYNLFSTQLYNLLPYDSIPTYIRKYNETLGKYYDEHDSQAAILQNSIYNYRIHQRQREYAEQRVDTFIYVIGGLILIILLFSIVLLTLRARKQALRVSLQSNIIKLNELQAVIGGQKRTTNDDTLTTSNDIERLKKRLITQIENIKNETKDKTPVNSVILHSPIYKTIDQYVSNNKRFPMTAQSGTSLNKQSHLYHRILKNT